MVERRVRVGGWGGGRKEGRKGERDDECERKFFISIWYIENKEYCLYVCLSMPVWMTAPSTHTFIHPLGGGGCCSKPPPPLPIHVRPTSLALPPILPPPLLLHEGSSMPVKDGGYPILASLSASSFVIEQIRPSPPHHPSLPPSLPTYWRRELSWPRGHRPRRGERSPGPRRARRTEGGRSFFVEMRGSEERVCGWDGGWLDGEEAIK